MLTGKDREIAVQAIAASASGTPSEVAAQILGGISALDRPGKPLVVWPVNLTAQEQLEALEREIANLRQFITETEAMHIRREQRAQVDSEVGRECQGIRSLAEASGGQTPEVEVLSIQSEAAKEACPLEAQKPAQEANDASQ